MRVLGSKAFSVKLYLLSMMLLSLAAYAEDQDRRPMPQKPYILMYGYYDRAGNLWADTLNHVNIITGTTEDAGFVEALRGRGIVFACHVLAREEPGRMTAQELAGYWISALENDLDGRLEGGFDAIAIDEIGQSDNTPGSLRISEALRITRERCPDRRIFVWGTWRTANGRLLLPPFKTYDTVLKAVMEHADLFLYECYIREARRDFGLFTRSARNLNNRVPGLLSKTLFGLYVSQSHPYVADDSDEYDFKDFLDSQFHLIVNTPLMRDIGGIAFWPFYRARMDTIAHINQLIRHYLLEGNVEYFGDGNYEQIVGDPGFERRGAWEIFPGNEKSVSVVAYRTESIPDSHSIVSHGKRCLKIRGGGGGQGARQMVVLEPGKWYTASALCHLSGPEGRPTLTALDSTLSEMDSFVERKGWWSPWETVVATFFAPPDGNVWLELSDEGIPVGTDVYWDFVEIEECRGMNRPTELLRVEYHPNESEIHFVGDNFMPGSTLEIDDLDPVAVEWRSQQEVVVSVETDFAERVHQLLLKKPDWCLHSHPVAYQYSQ